MGPKNRQHNKSPTQVDRKHGKPHNRPSALQSTPHHLPLELQQQILNVCSSAFPLAGRDDLSVIIQEVKGHLYNRDFTRAFGTQDYLDAYALRWSASRALAYADVLAELIVKYQWFDPQPVFNNDTNQISIGLATPSRGTGIGRLAHAADDPISTHRPGHPDLSHAEGVVRPTQAAENPGPSHAVEIASPSASKVVCIGGGAGAEVVALAATIQLQSVPCMAVSAIDIADWSRSLQNLQHSLKTAPTLSAYASESVKAAIRSLVMPDQIHVEFLQQDILDFKEDGLRPLLAGANLVTIMFTLNELFTTSISRTTALLLALTDAMDAGSWLLVIDSPGSYSEIKLGKDGQQKKYPMQWLLDHTLLQVAGEHGNGKGKWQKVEGEESRWFRVNGELRYPIELESMRFQMHLFHRQET